MHRLATMSAFLLLACRPVPVRQDVEGSAASLSSAPPLLVEETADPSAAPPLPDSTGAPGPNAQPPPQPSSTATTSAERPVSRSVSSCCSALTQVANSATPAHKVEYLRAAGVCNTLKSHADVSEALQRVRGALVRAAVPATCR